MAQLAQFYRGESIPLAVTPAEDESIDGCIMLVYLDDLDLTETTNASKVVQISTYTETEGVYVFEIPPTTSIAMKAGHYTVELYYGSRTIVRQNNAFLLVDSGYALKNSTPVV